MRVAFVTWSFPCLSNTFILNEITEVKRRGHSVYIYSIDRGSEEVTCEDVERFKLMEDCFFLSDFVSDRRNGDDLFDSYSKDWLGDRVHSLRTISRKLKRDRIDMIHGCFANNSSTVAMLLSRLSGIPWTFECHALDLFLDLRFEHEKGSECRHIFATSEYNRRHLIDELGFPGSKISLKRVSINKQFCDSIPRGDREMDLVVSVCRLHPIKGLDRGIEAFHELVRRGSNARYLIIGDGDLRDGLEEQVAGLGLTERVRFAGNVSNECALRWMAKASVFLLPSSVAPDGDRDGIPTSLIEAMYLEAPPIGCAVAGIPELIDNGDNGFLVAPGDVSGIADRLELLLNDSDLARRMGARARDKVSRDFDADEGIDLLLSTWSSILEGRRESSRLGALARRLRLAGSSLKQALGIS